MKINSAPRRDKEHKLLKDIADIYALLWHSDMKLSKLKEQLFAIIPKEKARKTVQNFSTEDINKVANVLGINSQEISRVLKEIT
jgi:signal recognition particle subunit SEC65